MDQIVIEIKKRIRKFQNSRKQIVMLSCESASIFNEGEYINLRNLKRNM